MRLPNNWKPRDYQLHAWQYLEHGGKHAELIWHRRAGKDDIALHYAATQTAEREATYWHMLPLSNQIRKAVWDAVNPHTGQRRVIEAFPRELFDHRDTDMMVRAKFNNSTWQCLGSDNYASAIGSPPAGITYSEWALANPSVRGYLRPIIAENNGYQIYITTPRGKNHAHRTFNAARKTPGAFAQILTIEDTGVLTPAQLKLELAEYISTYGEDQGTALFQQEYYCSFDAAILGAYYGAEFRDIDKTGRVCSVPHDLNYPVHCVFDIGYDDDTAIWWFQVIGNEVRIIDYYANNFKDPDHYCSQLLGQKISINLINSELVVERGEAIPGLEYRRAYDYAIIHLPHDARAKTLAAKGKSIVEQFAAVFGFSKMRIVPDYSVEDGIQATRKLLSRAWFDADKTELGTEAVRQYQREWDDDKKMFKDKPLHDWTSHPSDALRYLAIAWKQPGATKAPEKGKIIEVGGTNNMTLNEMWENHDKYIQRPTRI